MKKLILSVAVFVAGGIATTKANTMTTLSAPLYAVQDSVTKAAVKIEELPDAVKATLASDAYKEWIPSAAFLVKDAKGAEYYQIDVKKQDEVKSLKFDKEGKSVE